MKELAVAFTPLGYLFNTSNGILHVARVEDKNLVSLPNVSDTIIIDEYFSACTQYITTMR